MKNTKIIIVLISIALVGYFWWPSFQAEVPAPERLMSIESYITQNISTLSPEASVLGGTFYVTDIKAEDGRGFVSYEDGHIAFTADFSYETSEYGYTITSFTVRQ